MSTLEKFLALFFGVILVGVVITNPGGLKAIFDGLTVFTRGTTQAFAPQGFAGIAR
jgi:hypothetical protein